jgi:CTP synthase
VDTVIHTSRRIEIVVAGKYIELQDAYKSIYEAMAHAGIANDAGIRLRKISSDDITEANAGELLGGAHGVVVPGGFGGRGIEGKVRAIRHARENGIPFLGLCYGLQLAVIEFARNVCGLDGANSCEVDPATPHPVIGLLDEQMKVTDKGGTMRLGAQRARLTPGRALDAYGADDISERHRHRYEFNNDYRDRLEAKGMAFTGIGADKNLVEIVEIPEHPWFVAVQFHPEFKSKPTAAHPLFRDLVMASLDYAGGGRATKKTAPVGHSGDF